MLYDGSVLTYHRKDSCVLTPRRHHNKREKFIHVELSCIDLTKILAGRIGDKLAKLILKDSVQCK